MSAISPYELYLAAVNTLNIATSMYDEGKPIMSDKEWDDLYFQVVEYETNHTPVSYSPTQGIHYTVLTELKKVKHNHSMKSLDKTKDWNEFLRYFNDKSVIGMLKMDGLTCSLRYVNGQLVSAETRGDGEIGEDITHNAFVIKSIPKAINYKEELIIDGEVICTYTDFEPFAEEYKNPRNFAAGSIRLLDAKECEKRNLTFIAWNVIKGFDNENSFLNRLNEIEKLGFKVVPWTSSFDLDAKEFLIEQAEKYGYLIDGLVGRFDDIAYGESLGSTDHHSKAAYAFKFYDDEYETELLDIEWSMGRTGQITPVAIFKPVDDGISVIEKASLHNYSMLHETLGDPYVGQKIKVAKMNQIIPQVVWAELDTNRDDYIEMPTQCPVCGEAVKVVVSDSGTETLICENPQCQGKIINIIDHFCGKSGLDIKGLSKATLEKLLNWGWVNNITDIFSLNRFRKEWIQKPGFGVKSVDNILNAIEAAKNCELHSFISALGIPLIGSTYAKTMAQKEPDWFSIREDVEGHFDFSEWDSFGPEMCASLWSYDYKEADILANEILNISNSLYGNSAAGASLSGVSVAITGKLVEFKNRAALVEKIEANGGKAVSSVSSKTNYLINNDNTSNSAKNVAAKKYNIPILTEKEFMEKFLTL